MTRHWVRLAREQGLVHLEKTGFEHRSVGHYRLAVREKQTVV